MASAVRATTAAGEDLMLDTRILLEAWWTRADKQIQWRDVSTATTGSLLDYARDFVRSADVATRRGIAQRFANRARALAGVREIRLTSDEDELLVTVLTEQRDIELDLALQRIFIESAAGLEGGWSLRTRLLDYDDPEQDGDLI